MRRGSFNLSHHHLMTTDMGYLVPTACLEVLPGDTFRGQTSMLVRVAPLATPVMHPVDVRVHWWYVPSRIIWDEFDTWITGENEVAQKPTVTLDTIANPTHGWLADHFGIPPVDGLTVDALPFRAYNMIWNEFYRDQDLSAPRAEDQLDLARICWEKDYFTVAREKPTGDQQISIPFEAAAAPLYADARSQYGTGNYGPSEPAPPLVDGKYRFDNIHADLAQASGGISIEDLQRAMALRRFAIARARFGDRYVDYLRFLGINPSDGRLDRPEYVGGGKQTISFSEVLATAEGATSTVGDMYGHGLAALRTRRFQKMFEEHGFLLQLASVRPKTIYEDAVPKKFTRFDPMEHWQREFEIEPWQPVYQSEVHYDGDTTQIFGWQNKYEEYRHEMSYVSGSFRRGTEDSWHMARRFDTPPLLNESFVTCTPTDRIYSDTSMPELLMNVRHDLKARRLVRQNASLG